MARRTAIEPRRPPFRFQQALRLEALKEWVERSRRQASFLRDVIPISPRLRLRDEGGEKPDGLRRRSSCRSHAAISTYIEIESSAAKIAECKKARRADAPYLLEPLTSAAPANAEEGAASGARDSVCVFRTRDTRIRRTISGQNPHFPQTASSRMRRIPLRGPSRKASGPARGLLTTPVNGSQETCRCQFRTASGSRGR